LDNSQFLYGTPALKAAQLGTDLLPSLVARVEIATGRI
jgi:hypothetical protein